MMALVNDKGGLEDLFQRKEYSNPRRPPITQIMVFERGGRCLLWIGPRRNNLEEDMLSSLLSAICGFSLEALGLELSEIAAKQMRIFLSRATRLGVAIIVKEAAITDYIRIKAQVRCLMNRIIGFVSELEMIVNNTGISEDCSEFGFLRYEIEMAIAQTFPSSHVNSEEFGLDPVDIPKLRVLTYLGKQNTYTFAKIAQDLDLPNFIVEEGLSQLETNGFVVSERVRFGRRNIQTYHISELGKLVLDRIEVGFPGIWQ